VKLETADEGSGFTAPDSRGTGAVDCRETAAIHSTRGDRAVYLPPPGMIGRVEAGKSLPLAIVAGVGKGQAALLTWLCQDGCGVLSAAFRRPGQRRMTRIGGQTGAFKDSWRSFIRLPDQSR
jgi:hypothetical protein